MAKKKEKISFADMIKKIQGIVPESELASDAKSKINNWVSLGNYHLNAQVSGYITGGLPEGRILLLAGDPGTGKTFICLNACREAQKQHNSKIIWLDTEGAMDTETMERLGIDTSNALIVPVDLISATNKVLLNTLDDITGDTSCEYLFILDSIGNLSSDKENEDMISGSGKADFTKQKQLKALFRTLLVKLKNKKVPMICTSHTYDEIGGYIPKKHISGGSGSKYGASITLMLSTAQLKKDDDDSKDIGEEVTKTGVIITAKQEKARYTKAGLPIKLQVSFYKGMNKFYGLEDYLDWDNCGVAMGSLVEREDIITDAKGKPKKVKSGEFEFVPYKPGGRKTWAIKSLNKVIPQKDFWKNARSIFTQENMEYIDKICQDKYLFPEYDEDFDDIDEDDIEIPLDNENSDIFDMSEVGDEIV